MGHYHQLLEDLREPTKSLRAAIPDAWSGFAALHKGAFQEGEISGALKEVIALAISVVAECDGCIAAHARSAARKGATPGQVAEALGVVLLMNGGPASIYAPRAWAAYHEFAADFSTR